MAKTSAFDKIVSSAAAKANVVISKADLGRLRTCRPDSALARWIEASLVSERFLSDEEVRLSRLDGRLEPGSGPGAVPLREEELLDAITDLNAETEVLSRKALALEAQRTLVERRDGLARERRGRVFGQQIEEKNLNKIQRLKGEIDGVREEVDELFRMTGESIDRVVRKIPAMITELVNGHDRKLEGLAKEDLVGASTEVATSTNIDTIERLTTTLSRMVAEELQIRLDRTYLETLNEPPNHANGNVTDLPAAEDAAGLEQDLKSLYAEIPDVAAMYVAQEYREPLVRALQEEERQRRAKAAVHSDRVTSLLAGITVELQQLAESLRAFHSYRCAMRDLRDAYERFNISDKRDGPNPAKATSEPTQEFGPAMEAMLRHFGVSSTASRGPHESVDDKVARLRDNTQQSGLNAVVDARKALDGRKMLVESLLNGIDQNDEESLSKLDVLDARITRLREDVETVSGADTSQAVRRQRAFVEKWS